uniref:Uncharacterized protein n=1 Tax=Anguilla anguilla TaxID=7936 RepID=A0A0E9Y041_ANGAN
MKLRLSAFFVLLLLLLPDCLCLTCTSCLWWTE